MASITSKFRSERDFVAKFLLPKLDEAARVLGYGDVIETHIEPHKQVGIPDLIAEKGGRGLFVIEAKYKKMVGRVERDIEPRDPEVIRQAVNYAATGGYPWYATTNEKRLILFQMVSGKRPEECIVATFEFAKEPRWNEDFIKYVLGIVAARLKPLDETLVETLKEAFQDLYPEFLDALRTKKKEDRKFKKLYIRWLADQGLEDNEDTDRKIAAETTYLQINKLLFYQVIRVLYPDKLDKLEIKEEEDLAEALKRYYDDIKKIDYQPIYQTDTISQVPFTVRAKERVRTLVDTLNEFDFSSVESDFLGSIYEKLIPTTERKSLGQFYTPPQIAELILNLTVRGKDESVLDPACGSGTFLVKAYHRLRELAGIPKIGSGLGESYHKQLIEKLYGVDINQFAAHLSVINLSIQNPKARIDKVNVIVNDFFDIRPKQSTLFGFTSVDMAGKETEVYALPEFDVVVANPPYIRQEMLGSEEKEKIKSRIESQNKKLSLGGKKTSSNIVLDRQSDIYVYFFVHAVNMLKDGGRLGFIASNKWLEVAYGEPFQEFLLKYTKIKYVIEFDRAIFADAEVNTAVLILEKQRDASDKNVVNFVRFKKRKSLHEMLKIIQESSHSYEDEDVRVNVIAQKELRPGKWNVYLRAPPVLAKIVSNKKVTKLNKIAEVYRGVVTGYNSYFIMSRDTAKEWKIEKSYLRPCLSSPRKVRGLTIESDNLDEFLFVVNKTKPELSGTNALRYIEYGEKLEVDVTRGTNRGIRKLPELETLSNRQFWYMVPALDDAPILFQYLIDERGKAYWNKALAHSPNIIHYIRPKIKSDVLPLLAYLNSSICSLLVELHGRSYGGGVLKIEVYELKELPVLDPSTIPDKQRDRLAESFKKLAYATDKRVKIEDAYFEVKSKSKKNKGLFEDEYKVELDKALDAEEKARQELDDTVCDVLGLSRAEVKQIEEGLKELQEIRRLRRDT